MDSDTSLACKCCISPTVVYIYIYVCVYIYIYIYPYIYNIVGFACHHPELSHGGPKRNHSLAIYRKDRSSRPHWTEMSKHMFGILESLLKVEEQVQRIGFRSTEDHVHHSFVNQTDLSNEVWRSYVMLCSL